MASPRPVPPVAAPRGVGQRAEPLEGALPVRGRDPRALVGDVEPPAVAVTTAATRDPAALGAVAHGVVEHVGEQLAQPGAVGLHRRASSGTSTSNRTPRPVGTRSATHLVDQRRRPAPARAAAAPRPPRPGTARAGRRPGRRSAGPGRRRRPRCSGVGRHDAVGEVLQRRGQRGQRRTQLVGDRGDQVALLAVDGGQLGGHLVERAGQLADLVGGLGAHPAAVVAARHPPGRLGHLPQRGGHADRQQLGDAERQRDRDRHGEQHRHAGAAGRARRPARRPATLAVTSRPSLTLIEVTGCERRAQRFPRSPGPPGRSRRRARCAPGRRRPWRAAP